MGSQDDLQAELVLDGGLQIVEIDRCEGYRPVIIVAREGEQVGLTQ